MRELPAAVVLSLAALLAPPVLAQAQRRGPELVVVARLVAAPPTMLRCGRVHAAYVFQYEIARVVSGHYEGTAIYVAHSCPELVQTGYGRGLRVGSTYRLVLSSRKPGRWPAPADALGQPELPRWYAIAVRWRPD